jgi:large subunit ribosomal protein L23
MSEKAYSQSKKNTYLFNVPCDANKSQITDAVEKQFSVKVKDVKTLVRKGKTVRVSRGKNRYPVTAVRKDTKKAYVLLEDGNSIKVFDEPTEKEKENK